MTQSHPFQLVLHHRYAEGLRDLSGHGNHGASVSAVAARSGALAFDGMSSRVFVPPSPSLSRAGGIRADVVARAAELGRRRTLVEGYLSFSLTVEADGSLAGGVLQHGGWSSTWSRPGLVPPDTWLRMSLVCTSDGIVALELDGQVVGESHRWPAAPAGIRWPFGLSIGAWPDDDQRVWSGEIEEVRMWRSPATE